MQKFIAVLSLIVVVTPAFADEPDPVDSGPPPTLATPKAEPESVPLPPLPPLSPATPNDAALLAALLRLERALGEPDDNARSVAAGDAVRSLATLGDARAIPVLERLSRHPVTALRFSALGALGSFLDDTRARARLQETLNVGAPTDDAAIALPFLLEISRRFPGEKSVLCPETWTCADDALLLRSLLDWAEAPDPTRVEAVTAVGAFKDPRAIPFLWRQSQHDDVGIRLAALEALVAVARAPAAQQRLLDALRHQNVAERALGQRGLATLDGDDVTTALLTAREFESDAGLRAELEAVLTVRAPDRLSLLLVEEQRRLAAAAVAPGQFDTGIRAGLTAVAAIGAATGSAAASSIVADQIQSGSGAFYGAWGACAGCGSAAAIGWFALGDQKLDGAQVAMGVSASAWGAWTGLLIPPTIGPAATTDVRHLIYSAAAGQLLGLSLGTGAAIFTKPTMADVGEMNALVIGVNALTAGVMLSLPPSDDGRPLFGALAGMTAAGSVGAVLLAQQLSLEGLDIGHAALLGGITLVVGATAGGALGPFDDHPTRTVGLAFAGAGVGIGIGLAVGQLKLTPTTNGMVYETWAAISGGAVGLGGGLFIDALSSPAASTTTTTLALGGTALGVALGAASVAFFPDGVPQDGGDLLLQPLFIAFGLYHGGGLAAAAGADPRLTGAAFLLTPALASAGIVFAAPHIRASSGDVLMVASMMGFSAYFSGMGLASANAHGVAVDPAAAVLLTSLAMDAGVAAGVLLDLSDIEQVGWKTTYIASVAAGTTLILSLPGSLVASGSKGAVGVTDVVLGSSVLGVAVGFATMGFIDFRVAPDWGLDKRPDGGPPPVDVKPAVVALAPGADGVVPMGLGVIGRF
ncbi:MAG: HEAT repeat domain-containing protein [Deltaproteobacteria bacterium]|nr:HEAT repeat domain-containing protein [Deltaproteobacteria bacterium]